ncbi:hypothetical protein P154DRAFT_474621, partial [Amniculicola lignicola CBS 123094]
MPRLVRRAPLAERIQAYLDPWDWIMWAQEELNSSDWDEFAKSWAFTIGLASNIVFMIAKANSGGTRKYTADDVFGEGKVTSAGWLRWFLGIIVLFFDVAVVANAVYTFQHKRHYRLFEQPLDMNPSTPSAHRVRVDSSPSASPFRFFQDIFSSESAETRAHPDAARDVWELAVWDPNPLCLQLFCLFSPLHIILYHFMLPVAPLDPQPSVKVVTTVVIAAILSFHLNFLNTSYAQQIKDSAIIQREVLTEYDTKFVHPLVQRPSRDVGIQTITTKKSHSRDSSVGTGGDLASEIVTYTPTTVINRAFRTNPNQQYASQYDPDNLSHSTQRPLRSLHTASTPSLRPSHNSNYTSASTSATDFSSPIRQSNTPNPFRQTTSHGSGDGGSLG